MTNTAKIKKITLMGLVANVLLSLVKLAIGIMGNSQAVVADAMHSFSDTASDLVILFGVKYWSAPPDSEHPFGHGKMESMVTIIIGFLLMGTAAGIGYTAIVSLENPVPSHLSWGVLVAPVLSILVKEFLFRITYKTGIKIHSSSLKANAWHHRTDALSSIPVLAAVAGCLINPALAFLDQVGAILVSVFIIKVGYDVMQTGVGELLDQGMTSKELADLKGLIERNPEVKGFHKIRTRKLGGSFYVDLHLEVDPTLTVKRGHDISEIVKQALMAGDERIIDVMIHLEPAPEKWGTETGNGRPDVSHF